MKLTPIKENISYSVRTALEFLFVKNPRGTSIGVFLGISAYGITEIYLHLYKPGINLPSNSLFYFIAIGITILNIFPYMFGKKLNPNIEEAISLIEEAAKKTKMPLYHKRLLYIELYKKVLGSVEFNNETKKNLETLRNS